MQITKCFEILEVDNGAPWQVVKNSYYALAKKLHPDLNPSNLDAEMKFKKVNLAFQTLRAHFENPAGMSLVNVKSSMNPLELFFYRICHLSPNLISTSRLFTISVNL